MKIPHAARFALALVIIAAMAVLPLMAGLVQGDRGARAAFVQAEAEAAVPPKNPKASPGTATVGVASGGAQPSASAAPGGLPIGKTPPSESALTGARIVDGTSEALSGVTLSSGIAGQSAVLVKNGGALSLRDAVVSKTGDAQDPDRDGARGDAGHGDPDADAAMMVTSGGALTASGGSVSSASQGADAVIATGSGTTAQILDMTITTAGESARGINASRGGVVSATNVGVTTAGNHSAAIAASDGGQVRINRTTLSTAGEDSPLIYAGGSVTGANLTGSATASPMIAVDGGAVSVADSDLTGTGPCGVALYRSGDLGPSGGTVAFSAENSKLSSMSEGPLFFVTNTKAEATLTSSELTFESGLLAQVSGNLTNGWGAPGQNGGDFRLSTTGQVLAGDVTVDAISAFSLSLTRGSIYTGAVDSSNVGGSVSLSLDADSSWTLTADSHLDALTDAKPGLENIQSGGFMLYYDAENPACAWLRGATVPLPGGGLLTPEP